MNEDLKKALESLIDETISEIEELKKSRFSASEVDMCGPGEDGIKGHQANGHLDKDEDEDEDDKDMKDKEEAKKADEEKAEDKKEDKDKDEDKKPKKEEAEKAEGKNREADPNGGHHQMDKSEGKNREADPNGGHHKADAGAPMVKDEEAKKEEEAKKMDKMGYGKGMMAKGGEELDTLVKSLFDERFAPLEKKLNSILDLVNKIGDQPLPPKGVTAKMVPLTKSGEENVEPLSKAVVGSKLFELKKSGTKVDSLDVTKAELGQDLQAIAKKYNLA